MEGLLRGYYREGTIVHASSMESGSGLGWPPKEWKVGLRCDAQDKYGGWYNAKILRVDSGRVLVHFKGWGKENGKSKWDEWMDMSDKRIAALDTKSLEAVEERGPCGVTRVRGSKPSAPHPVSCATARTRVENARKGRATRDVYVYV